MNGKLCVRIFGVCVEVCVYMRVDQRSVFMCDVDVQLPAHLGVSGPASLYGSMTGERASANKGDYFDGAGQRRRAGLIMT